MQKNDRDQVRKYVANLNRRSWTITKPLHRDHSTNPDRVLTMRPKDDRLDKDEERKTEVELSAEPVIAMQSIDSLKRFELWKLPEWWFPENLQRANNVPGLIFHR